MNKQLYNERLMNYARDKRFFGEVKNANFSSQSLNVACGDSLAISGIVEDGIIKEVKFAGSGCMISQASAAMLLEKVIGMTIVDVFKITLEDVKQMLGVELGFLRSQCAELPLIVLHEALSQIQ